MTQKGHLKLVDKFQFNQKKFITNQVDEFQAIHVETKQAFTLKRLCLSSHAQREQSSRIINELTLLKKLGHNLIPKCHKLFKTSNNMYLIYERQTGTPISSLLQKDWTNTGNWDKKWQLACKTASELCFFLVFLKERKISHTLINLDNVLIENEAISKILNFSYAQQMKGEEKELQEAHKGRTFDQYCAPQLKNGRVTTKTDVYSAGAIFEKMFVPLKDEKSPQKLLDKKSIMQIQSILAFCSRMKAVRISERPTARQAANFFGNREYEEEQIKRSHQAMTPTIHVHVFDQDHKSIHKFHSPAHASIKQMARHYTDVGSETQDFLLVARKALHKRNLAQLLLQLSQFCSSVLLTASQLSNQLSFLFLKKSTLTISQLAKFLDTGRGQSLRMEEKTREKLTKHKLYISLEKSVHTEMQTQQQKLISIVETMKETLHPSEQRGSLAHQLAEESVDSGYFRKCIQQFQQQVLFWHRHSEDRPNNEMRLSTLLTKKQLIYFLVISFLTDFPSIEQFYERFFSQSGCSLWKESFLKQVGKLSQQQLQALILVQLRQEICKQYFKKGLKIAGKV